MRFVFSGGYPVDNLPVTVTMLSAEPKRLATEGWSKFKDMLTPFLARRAADGKRCLEAAIRRLSKQIVAYAQEELVRIETQADDALELTRSKLDVD